jgi:hypothetical protein
MNTIEKSELSGTNFINPVLFTNEQTGDSLEIFENEHNLRQNWTCKFVLIFNGDYQFTKQFPTIKYKADRLIEKYSLIKKAK